MVSASPDDTGPAEVTFGRSRSFESASAHATVTVMRQPGSHAAVVWREGDGAWRDGNGATPAEIYERLRARC